MRFGWLLTVVLLLVACQSGVQGPAAPAGHLRQSPAAPTAHTSPPELSLAKTPPRIMTAPRRYNVRVRNVPVGDILFALAQEEKLDLEIAPEVDERRSVTLTA
ncbi:MAG: hypothetical protein LBL69_01450, partial [Zoogloeaceae bacterium]|nr:hypothetical protein [Zoogloeaceae bacterium]